MADPADFKYLALNSDALAILLESRYTIVDLGGKSYDEDALIEACEDADPPVEEDHNGGDAYA